MKIEDLLKEAKRTQKDFDFQKLCLICDHFFGDPRQEGTSHRVYKKPWPGEQRVNIQKGKGGKAKAYQVRQVLKAVEKLKSEES